MILNQIKTAVLLAGLGAIFLLVGWLIGGYTGLTIGLAIALIFNFASYWFSSKIVLAIYKAKEIKKEENPELHSVIEEIAKEAKIPKPKVYLIPTDNANAFATGRNPKNAVVAVTRGILRLLSHEELKGVLAHEISHIKNRDILIQTIAATIATVISYVALMARFSAIFGRSRDSGELVYLLVIGILTPIIAAILQLAISRSREYLADERGARLIRNPEALASALIKIDENAKHHPLRFGSKTTSSLFISNPFKGKSLLNLFSTHPTTEKRVAKLRALNI